MSNPLLLPEIVASVIDNVYMLPDLLSCACVNRVWNVAALKKLYKGSLHDMRLRTPDIGSLNCLLVSSPKRFARNMSFVKHLLLSPEQPTENNGRGLASVAIPGQIKGQDWPDNIPDLLLTPTIEYLAIDKYYCVFLTDIPADKFSNLKALTVYKSDGDCRIDELCQLLQHCDLQFFHFEEDENPDDVLLTQSQIAEVLSCLQRHQNLKALALIVRNWPQPSILTKAWPRLKALYLEEGQDWLEQSPLPNFDELQILGLRNLYTIENIAECRHLRVIELDSLELDDVETLLDIARGCPLLQKFSMTRLNLRGDPDLGEEGENLLLNLLRALPKLEFLALGLKFRMDGALLLQDLARRCPRLAVLDLPRTQIWLSLAIMTNLDPLWQLEIMCLGDIYFEDTRRLLRSNNIESLATEWRRIFPRLREAQCSLRPLYMFREHSGEELEGDPASVSADEEMSLSEPGLDFDDEESDRLRRKLRRILGYGKDYLTFIKIRYMWQTDFEIEAIGWPVVPSSAFYRPSWHSTSRCPAD
ncbi:hypothetical protein CFD26_106578 [Aspergillus turcosus]|uniref:F-box domain-containing protein n=1 Tax=Aspergillus turcosus TaxID=1245748 RepID=A0A421D778_9EURO|nr:hypothetical protein CFD26_106578 [Aspergillus turcosus]